MDMAPAFLMVQPSYMMPDVMMQYTQQSGCFGLLATENPMVRLGEGDLMVYIKKLDVRTKVAAGQQAYNQLPSCTIIPGTMSTPTYLIRVRAEWDHHDAAAASRWGYSIAEAQRLAMRQGIFQQLRNCLLYGFNPALGEGLLNTSGATTINLPADSFGNQTVLTYDNGQMAIFFLTLVQQAKARMIQMGQPVRIQVLGPARTLGAFEYQGIVQLTSYQRPGGGSSSTADMFKDVAKMNGDVVNWSYDDTLIGKGAGGTDAVIIAIPEVAKPRSAGARGFATNQFQNLAPGLDATILQLVDMAAPREIPTPLAGGAIDVLSEMRTTSGWAIRPEAITIVSMQYS